MTDILARTPDRSALVGITTQGCVVIDTRNIVHAAPAGPRVVVRA
ncbi:MAG TPA: hypothetical protein VMF13_00985 [Luteitalea sp.]|nr:hypothetical protein [Luteitalea sp.]